MKVHVSKRFATIPHDLLYHPEISAKAKGLYAYIQGKPEGWDFSAERISLEMSDGRDGILTGLQELVRAGYLIRTVSNGSWGLWSHEYTLYSEPNFDLLPRTENPTAVEPTSAKPDTENPTVKKERPTKKDIQSKKEKNESDFISSLSTEKSWSLHKNQSTPDPLPHGERFSLAWTTYLQHRKEKKAHLTPTALILALKKLSAVPEEIAVSALEASVANGWTGFFIKPQSQSFSRKPPANSLTGERDYARSLENIPLVSH